MKVILHDSQEAGSPGRKVKLVLPLPTELGLLEKQIMLSYDPSGACNVTTHELLLMNEEGEADVPLAAVDIEDRQRFLLRPRSEIAKNTKTTPSCDEIATKKPKMEEKELSEVDAVWKSLNSVDPMAGKSISMLLKLLGGCYNLQQALSLRPSRDRVLSVYQETKQRTSAKKNEEKLKVAKKNKTAPEKNKTPALLGGQRILDIALRQKIIMTQQDEPKAKQQADDKADTKKSELVTVILLTSLGRSMLNSFVRAPTESDLLQIFVEAQDAKTQARKARLSIEYSTVMEKMLGQGCFTRNACVEFLPKCFNGKKKLVLVPQLSSKLQKMLDDTIALLNTTPESAGLPMKELIQSEAMSTGNFTPTFRQALIKMWMAGRLLGTGKGNKIKVVPASPPAKEEDAASPAPQ